MLRPASSVVYKEGSEGSATPAELKRPMAEIARELMERREEAGLEGVSRTVFSEGEPYRVHGRLMETDNTVAVLVSVQPCIPDGADPRTIQQRFGLTPKETEVALLLASGHTNQDISQALGVSHHTARHHTEKVLLKVGVNRRTDVLAAILEA